MIEIELDDREARRALNSLARRVADMTPAMHDIGQALVEGIRARVCDGQDRQGRPFASMQDLTSILRLNLDAEDAPLRQPGLLRRRESRPQSRT